MQPNIKIFVSTHRPDVYFPDNKYLNPIQVGTTEDKCFDNILHDNEGDNIADKNSSYCELTAQYYAYKNIDADYYGFFHYRRYLNFSERLYPETIKPFICGDVLAKDNSSKFLERYCINEEQMKKVINNIISNSVKYMDKPEGTIDIRILDELDSVRIEIEDNGKGIAQKDLQRIFDRFYRTDASRNSTQGGSGIGLSIVKKIIEDHGGYIWATSKEGEGTACSHEAYLGF